MQKAHRKDLLLDWEEGLTCERPVLEYLVSTAIEEYHHPPRSGIPPDPERTRKLQRRLVKIDEMLEHIRSLIYLLDND